MIDCLRTRVHKQPIATLEFEFETVLKFYNLEAWFSYDELEATLLLGFKQSQTQTRLSSQLQRLARKLKVCL